MAPDDVVLADMETFDRMPPELRDDHAALLLAMSADPTGSPCAWFDPDTRRCRHYEFRPALCRHFAPGSRECQGVRRGADCVWQDDNSPDRWRDPRVKPVPPSWDERRRKEVGWPRWYLLERLPAEYRADRRRGWNVFESVLRRFWWGRRRWWPSRGPVRCVDPGTAWGE